MDIDDAGLEFIRREEGCILHAYRDSVGVLTIGVGHAIRPGDGYTDASTLTVDEADALLHKDVGRVVSWLNNHVCVPLTQSQFNALVSLGFNIGLGALESSSVMSRLNCGNTTSAADAFSMWRIAGGKINPVLVARRSREAHLFLTGP